MCEDCIVYERCTSSEFSEDPGSSEMSEDCIFSKIVNPQNFLWIDFFVEHCLSSEFSEDPQNF